MAAHTYKVIELVGSSDKSVEDAIEGAVGRAAETLKNLDWFEMKEVRGQIEGGKVKWYQVKLAVGFRVLDPADVHREA
ncbi:MAG: dodecin [Dehalococcoidia bacterium]